MKRALSAAILLYPQPWRNRYEREFRALLGDVSPTWATFFNVFGGAMKMQFKTGSWWKIVAAFAVAGVIAGSALTWTIPHRYVSTAVIKMGDLDDAQLNAEATKILGRAPLTRMIIEADLYRDLRATTPLEEIVEQMKTDIMIRPAGDKEFTVSVTSKDAGRAQKATQILAANFLNTNAGTLVDPASLPLSPNGPRLSRNIISGLIAGVLLGSLVALFAGLKVWKLAAGLGIAGAITGAALAYFLPERFASAAVMRLELQNQALAGDRIRQLFQSATSDESCRQMVKVFQLYPGESHPERRLREHLHIEAVGHGSAIMIRYDYKDRYTAQKVVAEVCSRLIDAAIMQRGDQHTAMTLSLLDPASLSLRPYFPNRPMVVGTGVFVGLMAAIALGVWGRFKGPLPAVAAR